VGGKSGGSHGGAGAGGGGGAGRGEHSSSKYHLFGGINFLDRLFPNSSK